MTREYIIPESRPWRRWLITALTLLALAAATVLVVLQLREPPPPPRAEATDVRSAVTQVGDSLEVVVAWRLTDVPPAGRAESLRVDVALTGTSESHASMQSASQSADTIYLPAPSPGGTADGLSCVSAQHRGRLSTERCTPWRYVRPAAEAVEPPRADTSPRRRPAARAGRVVILPSGLQVDPDLRGRCAAWQRANPGRSVWIDVNRKAVPDCTGPNGRPTVAQFCAFIELANGRRVKSANSAKIPYCEQLFQEWARQRVT